MEDTIKTNYNFDLTEQEIELSKSTYGGKIIKCIIAPYHSYEDLKESVGDSACLFPERDLSWLETNSLIYNLVENDDIQETTIITSSNYIIRDMIQCCVRVLGADGNISRFPVNTLRINLLELEEVLFADEDNYFEDEPREFIIPDMGNSYSDKIITELIDCINEHIENEKPMSQSEFKSIEDSIKLIGDSYLRSSLELHCEKITVE
jgi:hypothetical protein